MRTVINPKSVVLLVVVGSMRSVLASNSLKEIKKAEPIVVLSAGKLRCDKYRRPKSRFTEILSCDYQKMSNVH
jgi:hypothetical protein